MIDDLDATLDALGDDIAAAQESTLEEPLPPLAIGARPERATGGRMALWGAGAVTVALAAAAALWLARGSEEPALEYRVDGAAASSGQWLEASELTFSDGSEAVFLARSSGRVTHLHADGAEVALERGGVDVRVVHRAETTRWAVTAGPFVVRVVGTEFSVRWRPEARVLTLTTHEGVVVLSGPVLGGPTQVRAGQHIVVDLDGRRAELAANSEEESEPEASPATETPTAEAPPIEASPEPPTAPRPTAPSTSGRRARPDWRALAQEAEHAEAIAEIDRIGFDRVLRRAPPATLLLLADTLRAERDRRAAQVYEQLRARHSGSREASRAAFMLGRMEQARQPARAAQRYRACLAEDPGPVRREAHGRLVEALHAAGDASATAEARRYLAAFPGGPHADFARSLLPR